MLSLNKLEKVIELEEQLRSEYQSQLDSKTEEINSHVQKQSELQAIIDARQATIEQQLATITELSGKATANQRTEQLNRELTNRAEKLQDEVTELKRRVKTLQKDLADERAETKALKQFDPARMKKNLDAGKKKLAEKTRANEVLQKSLSASKSDNAELQCKIKELEARLAELERGQDAEEAAA
jgi:chromosome segregation ATPase